MTELSTAQPRLSVPVSQRDHIRGGPATAAITIVTYGDYECGYTRKAQGVLADILADRGEDVRLVYRHFPLHKIHPHAQLAAETAEAAGAQGQFWRMHDLLFANQRRMERDDLLGYADTLGLDVDRVDRELSEHVHAQRIRDDLRTGVGSGVASTPNIFVNGVLHPDRYAIGELHIHIDALIRRSP